MNCKEFVNWIDAYVDQEVELTRQLEMEQHVKGCSVCARSLQARQALQTAVRRAPLRFDPPSGLEQRLHRALEQQADPTRGQPGAEAEAGFGWRGWWGGFVSAAVLTSTIFLIGPSLMRPSQENRLAQEVMNSHVRALMSNHLTDVTASNQHVVKPWFNGKIDFSPEVHDWADHGFPLAGGRVDYIDHHPVAALVYHRALHPIHLFIWPGKSDEMSPMKLMRRRGYHLFHWSDAGMTYWMISDLNANELKELADLIRAESRVVR